MPFVTRNLWDFCIELTEKEALELAEFLNGFYLGDASVMDKLSEQLDALLDAP